MNVELNSKISPLSPRDKEMLVAGQKSHEKYEVDLPLAMLSLSQHTY